MHVETRPSRGPNTTEHRTIVVGYDGSSEAQAALAAATARAGKGGTVVAVYASEPASDWLDTAYYARALEMRRQRAATVFEELPTLDLADDVTVEAELVDGSVPEALAEVAKLRDAEEIAVGSRRLGWFRGAVGSVSRRVLREADRPVVVVPRAAAEAAPARRTSGRSAISVPSPISAHRFRF
jgi:nucleotide-binding universal stress UspA family protein